MLLTISTAHRPTTDLELSAAQESGEASFELSFGWAHVFYPEATEDRCTAAMLLGYRSGGSAIVELTFSNRTISRAERVRNWAPAEGTRASLLLSN
jgi:RNA repair, ligase-Pnkp-associating, region of Hen1